MKNIILLTVVIFLFSFSSNKLTENSGAFVEQSSGPDIVMADAPWSYWESTKKSGQWTFIKFLDAGKARVIIFKEDLHNPSNYGGVVSYGNSTWKITGKQISVSGEFNETLTFLNNDGEFKYGVLEGNEMRFAPVTEVAGVLQSYYPKEIKFFYTGEK